MELILYINFKINDLLNKNHNSEGIETTTYFIIIQIPYAVILVSLCKYMHIYANQGH